MLISFDKTRELSHSEYIILYLMFSLNEVRKRYYKSKLIKSKNYDEDASSFIMCLEPATFPFRCTTCKLLMCKTCAEKWKKQQDTCPKRCKEDKW
jgi:hypothetical protein